MADGSLDCLRIFSALIAAASGHKVADNSAPFRALGKSFRKAGDGLAAELMAAVVLLAATV